MTTEDPAKNFQPDNGRIEVFKSGGGMGIRLDGAQGFTGAIISPYYDSLLVKVISHAKSLESSATKLMRSLNEFTVKGVRTNIPFLLNVLRNKNFLNGKLDTHFIDEHPELFILMTVKSRGHRLISYLGEILVNGPLTPLATDLLPAVITPMVPKTPYGKTIDGLEKFAPELKF